MKKILFIALSIVILVSGTSSVVHADYKRLPQGAPVYRLYNLNTGEHFYTMNPVEKVNLINLGWQDENIGWYAPYTGGAPVYRLFNPNAAGGDHYYTQSLYEKDSLVKAGWKYEGISWNSAGTQRVQVSYNPNAQSGAHHYTTNSFEHAQLLQVGWKYGANAWSSIQSNDTLAKLPKPLGTAAPIRINLDDSINSLRSIVLQNGNVPLGTRAMIFHQMGANMGFFKDGAYWPGRQIPRIIYSTSTPGNHTEMIDAQKVNGFYTSSFYPVQQADGEGNETAILTAKGWYLLPDVSTNLYEANGAVKIPDLAKFIATGNPADFKFYTDGTPLVYNKTDQFGKPILIS